MKYAHLSIAILVLASIEARAGGDTGSTIWSSCKGCVCDSPWIVQVPTQGSDYFDQTFTVNPGLGNTEDGNLSSDLLVSGVAVSVVDFSSNRFFETIGVYYSNSTLDPSNETPDLSVAGQVIPPLTASLGTTAWPGGSPPAPFHFAAFETSEGAIAIPTGTANVHVVVQLPPGDLGLLSVGADSNSTGTTGGLAGWTSEGYKHFKSNPLPSLDFGMNVGQDNSATTSCRAVDRRPHGRLRCSNLIQGIGEGDHLGARVRAGDTLNLAFFGTKSGDKWRLYFNVGPCTPAVAIGPLLPTIPDPDGSGSYLRINTTWPSGFGGQTFRFSAVWGNPACANAGVGFTNCVSVITAADPAFGTCDDGTVETSWVVQNPSGASDYFNNNLGNGTGKNGIVDLTVSVLDFGTTATGFPTSGVSNANTGVDASGNTPDISGPGLLALVSPFTFPAGAFETTSVSYKFHGVSIREVGSEVTFTAGCSFRPTIQVCSRSVAIRARSTDARSSATTRTIALRSAPS